MKTRNSMQLKAYINNRAKELNVAPQLVLQNYMLERLLDRMSRSEYAGMFIIKGGFLLSSIVGLATRATMDLDTTVKGFTLNTESLEDIMMKICEIQIDDDISFKMVKITDIRETDDYPGLRVFLEANYPPMRVPLTVDVTTGDAITPKEVEYDFKTMFDNMEIRMKAYPIETVLAEKVETILSRSIANTRPRDFYDVYVLHKTKAEEVDYSVLSDALAATCAKRNSEYVLRDYTGIVETLIRSVELKNLWKKYQKAFPYAGSIDYEDTCKSVREIMEKCKKY